MPLKKLSKSYGTSYAGLTASLRDMSGQPARYYGMPDDLHPVPNGQITLNAQGGFGVYVDDSKLYQVVIYGSTPGVVMLTDLNIEVDSASASNGLTAAQVEAGATSVVGVTNSGTLVNGVGTPVSGGGGGGGSWGSITGTLSAQTDLQSALDAKVPSSRTVAGKALTADVSLVKADVGLGNVDNTSDADKPVSTATLTALNAKQATLVSATNIKTINGASILGSGDMSVALGGGGGAWGGITGTLSDQTDLQAALSAKQASLVSGTNIKTVNGSSIVGSGDLSVALNTTVTLEHLPSTTAWAATITPASYVSRFGFSSNVAITVTVAGVTSPAANIQIQYSNDAGVSISSGPTTIGTIAANGSQTINIAPTTMPGGQFKVLITSGTGTGGTVGINVTMS